MEKENSCGTNRCDDNVIEGFRLSLQQKRLWRRQGWRRPYRAQCEIGIDGDFDGSLLRDALSSIIHRHEILRTTFHRLPGMELPLQVIGECPDFYYRETDLRGVGEDRQKAEVTAFFDEDALKPFDAEKGPILRCALLRMGARNHVLLISLPALCADGATLENLAQEILAYRPERAEAMEEDGDFIQYVDYAEWQYESFAAGDEDRRRDQPAPVEGATSLPFELSPSESGEFAPLALDVDPFGDLFTFALETGVTADLGPADILLCCWMILLSRSSGKPVITAGVLNETRTLEPLRGSMGPYAQYLPVESRFPATMGFLAAAAQLSDEIRLVSSRAEQKLKEQNDNRAETYLPFVFDAQTLSGPDVSGHIRCSILRRQVCIDRFKLKLSVTQTTAGSAITLEYDPAYYLTETVERLAERFRSIVRNVAAEPWKRIDEIDVLGAAERELLLETWNATAQEFPAGLSFHGAFERQSEQTPDAVAVVMNDEHLSFGEVNRRANQLARYLIRRGVGLESLVGVLMERSPKLVECLLAIMKSGGVYAPLDPYAPSARLEPLIAETRMSALLVSTTPPSDVAFGNLQVIDPDLERLQIEQERDENLEATLSPENLAYIIFTSGSTGRPKGVATPHGAAINFATGLDRAVYEGCSTPRIVSLNAPLVFDASIKQIAHLFYGHRLVIIPEEIRRDAERMLAYARLHEIETLDCTPSHLEMLRTAGFGTPDDHRTTKVLVGGEAIDQKAWDIMAGESGREYFNHYGPTECTVNATICRVAKSSGGPSIGGPLANTKIYLVNESLLPAPIGAPGELLISGAGVTRGYVNRPEWTAEKFIPDPFSLRPGNRMYRSGDLARRRADGPIEFVGRCDSQVKIRGNRVEPGEIEAVLRSHPKVREAVVTATRDEAGAVRLTAYIIPGTDLARRKQAGDLSGELRGFALHRLPDYMTPTAFVELAELPLTPNGKLDRAALPPPDRTAAEKDERAAARARTLIEEILVGIWGEVLQVEHVVPEDNFFQLGGHSLLATQLISRVRAAFQVDLPLRSLFETSTVAELAERIDETINAGRGLKSPAIEPAPRDGPIPLSFAQQRLWFLDHLEPGNPTYLSVRTLRLKGALNIAALESALHEVVRRHEILRSYFVSNGQAPEQRVTPVLRQILRILDLRDLPGVAQDEIARRIMDDESRRPFSLDRPPLLRLTLLRFNSDLNSIVIAVHHIIVDGWSMNIFAREINQLYRSYTAGVVSPLRELAIQYGDFALWQQRWLSGEALEDQLSYWRRKLAGSVALKLPVKRSLPETRTFRGAIHLMDFPPGLAAALKDLSRREGATFFMTMLTGFKFLLSLYTGQDDILVGAGIANRNRVEIEPLIGFFVNMLALRADLSGNPSFQEALKRVREVALEAYSRQDVPLERLVADLRPEWEPGRNSLFQATFFFQTLPDSTLDLQDVAAESWSHHAGVLHFDMLFFIFETSQGMTGGIEYNTDIFERDTIERMTAHLTLLLEKAAAAPETRLLDISFEPTTVVNPTSDNAELFSFQD